MHAIEMAFERVEMSGPEVAELSQPVNDLMKRLRSQPVEAALGVHGGFDEAGLAQHAQVLGDGRLRHAKLTLNLSHRLLGGEQKAQDGAAVGLGNDFEDGFHSLHILYKVYTCQGIYRASARQRRAAVTGTGDVEHVQVILLDDPGSSARR
jgi:hypothetical protein